MLAIRGLHDRRTATVAKAFVIGVPCRKYFWITIPGAASPPALVSDSRNTANGAKQCGTVTPGWPTLEQAETCSVYV